MGAPADLSVYIHIPFCVSRCRYCDFYSIGNPDADRMESCIEGLKLALATALDRINPRRIESIFIGGGTPSMIPRGSADRLLADMASLTGPVDEWTIEANPESIDGEFLGILKAHGVDRISMGVQSYDDGILEWLGRPAGRDAVLRADELLRSEWGGRLSRDLMAALPRAGGGLNRDIDAALADDPGHLSLYELTVEDGTPLAGDARALAELPGTDSVSEEWTEAKALLAGRGYRRYEISNFARPGEESRHNLRYWRMAPYLGIGPSAVSTLPDERGRAIRREEVAGLAEWLKSTTESARSAALSRKELALEHFMMGLRTVEGVSRRDFKQVFGIDPVDAVPGTFERWNASGCLECDESAMRPTDRGMDLLDAVLRDIVTEWDGGPEDAGYRWPPS